MKLKREQLKLYLVTDRTWLNPGEELKTRVEMALKAGATMVQLREKQLSFEEYVKEAHSIKKVCRKYQVPFVINDRVDVAMAVDADGVHLGLSDGSLTEARKLLGPDKIIGASAHNVTEALEAERQGASYLGCGAVFGSSTKKDVTVLSKEELKAICHGVRIPVAAIGGINEENISTLSGLGLSGAAVVSAVFRWQEPEEKVKELLEKLEQVVDDISIRVNGENVRIPIGWNLDRLLKYFGYLPVRVAVERNDEIVPRNRFDETVIEHGDVLEVVSFVGGG